MPDLTVSVATGNPISVSVSGNGAATATVSSGGTATVTVAGTATLSGAGKTIVSSGGLADLTSGQQAQITQGVIVVTTDGYRWIYSGAGSVTSQASYVQLADITPEWGAISGVPSTFPPETHTHTLADIEVNGGTLADSGIGTFLADLQSSGNIDFAIFEAGGINTTSVNGLAGVATSGSYTHLGDVPTSFPPSAHKSSHATGGSDALTPSDIGAAAASHSHGVYGEIQDAILEDPSTALGDIGAAAADHVHGNITTDGKIGTASGEIVVTGAGGALTTAATLPASSVSGLASVATSGSAADLTGTLAIGRIPTGTTSSTVCIGNDSRLSDSRSPTAGSVTDSSITSGGLSASSINWAAIAAWAPSTSYAKGDLVEYLGVAYRRSAAGTSGATFSGSANWQQVTPTSFVVGQLPTVLEKTVAGGNTGTAVTLSLASGSVQTWTLNGNCTFTMPSASAGASLTIILNQGGTNTATFTGVLWPGGTAPTITATANKRDILVFVSDGTSWYGAAQQNF